MRRLYKKEHVGFKYRDNLIKNQKEVSDMISDKIISGKPFMLSRLGLTELMAIINYIDVLNNKKSYFKYITHKQNKWWWDENVFTQMSEWSGFFPSNANSLSAFSELYLKEMIHIDILAYFNPRLSDLKQYFNGSVINVYPNTIEPHKLINPWTKALKNKKVLVIHPFESSIKKQYMKRKDLFDIEDFLPSFNLKTIRAVQSLGGKHPKFNSWFEALDYMKNQIDKHDFDICLIGCGAYGLPLAAHVKKSGKQAIHIGGSLQLIFGIKGKRWDNDNLYNDNWVRPQIQEKPENAENVEDNCYW
tara:strand:- start:35 stop:943 length:909 start_codon:yes stop_codon:yes gene_type:complete